MKKRINPFRPNSPVPPGMFIGRMKELSRLEGSLMQTMSGNPMHFMITGERGIGKTSLLMYIDYAARGSLSFEDQNFNFLVLNIDIDPSSTQLGIVKRIKLALDRELGKSEPAKKFLKDSWDFLQRLRIADSGISAKEETISPEILLDEFAYSLAQVINRTCEKADSNIFGASYNGIVLLIDEADNASDEFQIGSFFKLLLERLQKHDCNRILVGLAGLEDLRNKLLDSHPSSLRIFEEIPLMRLSNKEVEDVIDICIKMANEENVKKTTLLDDARKFLIQMAEGYPHFIQQFGYSSFEIDNDGAIDMEDVIEGAFGGRGALELIGDRYYRNAFYSKIQRESYRQVLKIMAYKLDSWITKKEIKSKFKGNESTLNNAIKALRDRYIIFSKEGTRGVYRLQHKGFALWMRIYADPDFFEKVSGKLAPKSNKTINNK